MLNRVLAIGVIAVLISNISLARQLSIQEMFPVAIVKTVDGDDPARFANPSSPGRPIGDLNGDGLDDYIQVIRTGSDLRDPDSKDSFKTIILSYDEDGEVETSITLEGRYFPLGDINNDGIRDIGRQLENGKIEILNLIENQSDVWLEFDRYEILDPNGDLPRIGESLNADLNGDGINDAVLCENEFDSFDRCLIIEGIDDPQFLVPTLSPALLQLNTYNMSIPPRLLMANSIAGSGTSLYLYGRADNYTAQKLIEIDYESGVGYTSVLEYDYQNSSSESLIYKRIHIEDIDGDGEQEIVSSDDREFPISGFRRITSNPPVCDYREIDYSGDEPSIQSPTVISSNCVIDRLYEDGQGDIYAGFWQEGNYASCSASDFQNECSNATFYNDDQTILPCSYDSCKQPYQEPGVALNGVADPSIASRGIQKWVIENTGDLTPRQRRLILEVARIAEVSTVIALRTIGVSVHSDIIRANYFNGSTQADYSCRVDIPQCELTERSDYRLYLSVESVDVGQLRSSSSSVRGGKYHHYTISVDDQDKDRVNYHLSEEEIYELLPDDFLGPNDKLVAGSNENENDSLTYTGQFDLDVLGTFDPSFDSFVITNIGNIDGNPGEEILLGSNNKAIGNNRVNKAWIYLGDNTTYQMPDIEIDFVNDSTIDASDYLSVGNVASPLGDINGDGFNDFAVGLPFYDQRYDGVSYGAVYVYLGQDFSVAKQTSNSTITEPFMVLRPNVETEYTLGTFGSQVTGGDFDGDGFNDIAVLADNGSTLPISPTIRIYKGGADMDSIPDYNLYVTEQDVGGFDSDTLTSFFDAIISFMPEEADADHQDLYFSPGSFSGYPDAVIFTGGIDPVLKQKGVNSPKTTPSFTLAEAGPTPTGSGVYSRAKPAVADFNGDGKYDVVVEKQYDGRDGIVSSRLLIFSPNSGIDVSNELLEENPLDYRLSQNYPNPFNPSTNIEFRLGNSSNVTLKVFDVLGREVATLISDQLYTEGSHSVRFDASKLASGLYLYRLEAGGFIQTRKMMLIK